MQGGTKQGLGGANAENSRPFFGIFGRFLAIQAGRLATEMMRSVAGGSRRYAENEKCDYDFAREKHVDFHSHTLHIMRLYRDSIQNKKSKATSNYISAGPVLFPSSTGPAFLFFSRLHPYTNTFRSEPTFFQIHFAASSRSLIAFSDAFAGAPLMTVFCFCFPGTQVIHSFPAK